mmetsp:Transcript_17280/g.47539  ORF Transcript_17280/g.47539 Transcript_17280/m.47539 type:complete len:331 (+) Transcript_17280:711-1703(+)
MQISPVLIARRDLVARGGVPLALLVGLKEPSDHLQNLLWPPADQGDANGIQNVGAQGPGSVGNFVFLDLFPHAHQRLCRCKYNLHRARIIGPGRCLRLRLILAGLGCTFEIAVHDARGLPFALGDSGESSLQIERKASKRADVSWLSHRGGLGSAVARIFRRGMTADLLEHPLVERPAQMAGAPVQLLQEDLLVGTCCGPLRRNLLARPGHGSLCHHVVPLDTGTPSDARSGICRHGLSVAPRALVATAPPRAAHFQARRDVDGAFYLARQKDSVARCLGPRAKAGPGPRRRERRRRRHLRGCRCETHGRVVPSGGLSRRRFAVHGSDGG